MKNDDLETAKQGLIERARKIMALQKRLERAEETRLDLEDRLERAEETRLELEERLECAEENLANVLGHKSNILSVTEVSDDDELQFCGTCEEMKAARDAKLKEKDDEIMDLKKRLKCVEERLEYAEESRDHARELVEGPIIHSLKVILDNAQENLILQRTGRLHIDQSCDYPTTTGWVKTDYGRKKIQSM
jgi:hypothetical protein